MHMMGQMKKHNQLQLLAEIPKQNSKFIYKTITVTIKVTNKYLLFMWSIGQSTNITCLTSVTHV